MLPNLLRWRQTGSRLARVGWGLLVVPFTAGPGPAQEPVPVGDQFQVNTYTTQDQRRPAVAMDADGDFVVVWATLDGPGAAIQGQRYDSSGAPLGGEFAVNSSAPGDTTGVAVAADAGGDFVVVWDTWPTPYERDVQGRRFASSGAALGSQFQVNTYTTDYQVFPAAASDADGDFVVVWESVGSFGSDSNYSIQGQRYASDGTALGGQFQVNSYTTSSQSSAAVAAEPNGDFVVVWESLGSSGGDTSDRSIQGQRYASDGTALGVEFEVNAYTPLSQDDPAVAMGPDGAFVVAWRSNGSFGDDDSQTSIQGRRYASSGAPLGGQLQVNTYTTGSQRDPAVAADADGDFLVTWSGALGDEIHARHYSADGTASAGQFQVNTYTTGPQDLPAVAGAAGGRFAIVWQSDGSPGTDSSGISIQGQRYAGAAPVPSISAPGSAVAASLMLIAVARLAPRRRIAQSTASSTSPAPVASPAAESDGTLGGTA